MNITYVFPFFSALPCSRPITFTTHGKMIRCSWGEVTLESSCHATVFCFETDTRSIVFRFTVAGFALGAHALKIYNARYFHYRFLTLNCANSVFPNPACMCFTHTKYTSHSDRLFAFSNKNAS